MLKDKLFDFPAKGILLPPKPEPMNVEPELKNPYQKIEDSKEEEEEEEAKEEVKKEVKKPKKKTKKITKQDVKKTEDKDTINPY